MKKNILNKLLIVCCLVALTACKAHKQLVTNPSKKDSTRVIPSANKLSAIKSAQLNFNTFSGRAKTTLSINGKSNDVTMNIRISKGQKIWVSITAIAGIEVARALITPDSIKVINKLQSLYVKKPFNYIYRFASKQIDYNSLEALFVGNAIPQLLTENAKMQVDSLGVTFSGNLDELVYKMIVNPDLKVQETDLSNPAQVQSLQVNNGTFIQATNRTFPSQINIASSVGNKKLQMNLRYIKADFDLPLEYPFNIPSGYEEGR
jgi:uncharacterized protein DUF4292